jgi:hypothetical protein
MAAYAPYIGVMQAVNAREHAGDATGALDLMERHLHGPDGRPFWSSWRVDRLLQVATLEDLLPGWALSRWLLAQAMVNVDEATRPITTSALAAARRVGGYPASGTRDPEVRSLLERVVDHDWVHRQAFLYDEGGLRRFTSGRFAPGLVARAEPLDAWESAPMGAYRFLRRTPRVVWWEDVASGEEVETVNLGAAVELAEGGHVLGRVVPAAEGLLFESPPLPVPGPVAAAVAASPAAWVEALADHADEVETLSGHPDLLTDVPRRVWTTLAGEHALPARADGRLGEALECPDDGDDCPLQAGERLAAGLVLVAAAGGLDDVTSPDPWPCVSAAAVAPGAWLWVLAGSSPGGGPALAALGERLVGPAASLCWRSAQVLRSTG